MEAINNFVAAETKFSVSVVRTPSTEEAWTTAFNLYEQEPYQCAILSTVNPPLWLLTVYKKIAPELVTKDYTFPHYNGFTRPLVTYLTTSI